MNRPEATARRKELQQVGALEAVRVLREPSGAYGVEVAHRGSILWTIRAHAAWQLAVWLRS